MNKAFALLILLPLAIFAQDFDFIEEESKSEKNKPFRWDMSLNAGKQIASPSRWIDLGPSVHAINEMNVLSGQIYLEATLKYNHAYQIEQDSVDTRLRYQWDGRVREVYYAHSQAKWGTTLGRQIISWSKTDFLSSIDLLTRKDKSQLFFAKAEDARVGQDALKFDVFFAIHQLSLVLIPYARPDILVDGSHPYAQSLSMRFERNVYHQNPEWAFRFNSEFEKSSMALMSGLVHNRQANFNLDFSNLSFRPLYHRYYFTALAHEQVIGSFQIKNEFFYSPNFPFQELIAGLPSGEFLQRSYKYTFGIDYSLQEQGTLTLEMSSGYSKIDKNKELFADGWLITGALYWSRNFFNQDLSFSIVTMFIENLKNTTLRYNLLYKLNDNWHLSNQWSFFWSDPTGDFVYLKNLDRVDLNLKYYF